MTDSQIVSADPMSDEQSNSNEHGALMLVLDYDPDTRELYGELLAGESPVELNNANVRQMIADHGYADLQIATKELNAMLAAVRKHTQGRYFIGIKPEYTDIRFKMDDSSGVVYAELSASEASSDPGITVDSLQHALDKAGFSDFYYKEGVLTKLLTAAKQNHYGRLDIGQRKDAEVLIEVDDEEMRAYISIKPPMGGSEFNNNLLKHALIAAHIDGRCCDKKVLARLLKEKTADKLLFAEGKLPTDGKDTQFEPLVTEVIYREQEQNTTGRIDFREVKDFTLVEPGTELMRRTPAVDGVNGYNVRGLPIPADHGEDIPWNTELKGVSVSSEDENLLVAEVKGHPVIKADGVDVDDTLVVNNVSMTIGNIDFDGSVLVKGEVMPGMTIKATGDIRVNGVVTGAKLIAKNNIVIGCGVIGSEKDGDSTKAQLVAGGDIYAQYANLCRLKAAGSVYVKEYISHCDTEAKHSVFVGQSGGKGKIFGGECYASESIAANSVGIDGGVKTYLTVGPAKSLQEQYAVLKEKQAGRLKQAAQLATALNTIMKDIKDNPTDLGNMNKAKKLQSLQKSVAEGLEKMGHVIEGIERKFKENRKAHILVTKHTQENVYIKVNGAQFFVRQEGKGGKFVKFGRDIRWEGL